MPGLVNCGVAFFSRCLISPCSSHFDNHLYTNYLTIFRKPEDDGKMKFDAKVLTEDLKNRLDEFQCNLKSANI